MLAANEVVGRMWVDRTNLASYAGTTSLASLPGGQRVVAVNNSVVTVTVTWRPPGQSADRAIRDHGDARHPTEAMERHAHGFSLIELMVGVVLAIVVFIIITQTLATFENQRRATTGGSDSAVNGSIALFQLERDARMAAFGFTSPTGMLCPLGVNIYYNGTTFSNGAALAPILITDGASGAADQLRFARSYSAYGIAPSILVAAMGTPTGRSPRPARSASRRAITSSSARRTARKSAR